MLIWLAPIIGYIISYAIMIAVFAAIGFLATNMVIDAVKTFNQNKSI